MTLSDDVIPVLVNRVPFITGSSPRQGTDLHLAKLAPEGFQDKQNWGLVHDSKKMLLRQAVTHCSKAVTSEVNVIVCAILSCNSGAWPKHDAPFLSLERRRPQWLNVGIYLSL